MNDDDSIEEMTYRSAYYVAQYIKLLHNLTNERMRHFKCTHLHTKHANAIMRNKCIDRSTLLVSFNFTFFLLLINEYERNNNNNNWKSGIGFVLSSSQHWTIINNYFDTHTKKRSTVSKDCTLIGTRNHNEWTNRHETNLNLILFSVKLKPNKENIEKLSLFLVRNPILCVAPTSQERMGNTIIRMIQIRNRNEAKS